MSQGTEFDAWEEMEHRVYMRAIDAQKAKLLKLNKAELLCLAVHFKVPYPDDYREGWACGGKLDLAIEIARIMVDAYLA